MKKIAGKTFMTREEAGLPPLTAEEIEETKRLAREGRAHQPVVSSNPSPSGDDPGDKFRDDMKGTEFDPDWPPTPDKSEGEGTA